MTTLTFRWALPVVATAGAFVVSTGACAGLRGGAGAPERPLRCPIERAVAAFAGDAGPSVDCGYAPPDGFCHADCQARTRECIFRAIRAKEPFSASWSRMHEYDAVREIHIVGRRSDEGYEVRWYDYDIVPRCGPPGNCGDRTHAGWRARRCNDIVELDAVCAKDAGMRECAGNDRDDQRGLTCADSSPADSCED